jgi:hypothetical protein
MRKAILLLTMGLFLSASVANACDGEKTAAKKTKATKEACKMDKKACTTAVKEGKCDMKATAASGKMDCCAKKAGAKEAVKSTPKSDVKG